jgi:hypothetical protein
MTMDRSKAWIAAALWALLAASSQAIGGESDPKMEAWAKAMAPGKAHAELEEQVGEWSYVVKFWQKAGEEPTIHRGTAVKKMVLGGRFLEEDVTGEYEGGAFHGRGITGFNNVTKQWEATWFDDAGTALQFYVGKANGKGGREYTSTYHDPVSGRAVPVRSVSRSADRDHHTFESYMTTPEGKEMRVMVVEYTRAGR